MVREGTYVESGLDGQQPGGFVILNVDAPTQNPYQVLDDDNGGYYPTLQEAREACSSFREESGNDQMYVYAVMGVADALKYSADDFAID